LKWNFEVPPDYIVSKNNLEVWRREVFVSRVVDGDTIEIILKS